jgi:UMF1 family MFS transporter
VSRKAPASPESRAVRAWCLYDWANSAFATTVVAAVLPPYYFSLASRDLPGHLATATYGYASAVAMLSSGVVGVALGALSDRLPRRKPMLLALVAIGSLATLLMAIVPPSAWWMLLVLLVVATIPFAAGNVIYDSLLPTVARPDQLHRVSARGFAYGYIGGGVLLAINAAWISAPGAFGLPGIEAATRLSLASVAVWWLGFSLPLFRHVPEPAEADRLREAPTSSTMATLLPGSESERRQRGSRLAGAFRDLARTLAEARRHPDRFRFLLAFWLYSDGIGTIVRMAGIYGSELGLSRAHLVGALLMVQILAAPMSLLFGRLAHVIGARRAVILGLVGYAAIPVFAYFISRPRDFWILAAMVAMVQGGTQALSRSLFAPLVPRRQLGQMFGFYSVSEKLAGIVGPLLFGMAAQVAGSSRIAVLTLIPLFLGGAWLLSTVDFTRGAARAREEERP